MFLTLEGMKGGGGGGHFDPPPLGFFGIKNLLFYRLPKAFTQLFFNQ